MGIDGSKLALMNGQTLSKAYVPLPGGATAVYNSSGLAYYMHSDWLGSSRLASSPSRAVLYDGAYAPFGESYAEKVNSGTAQSYHSFTGQNEDTIQGLDDFMYREYSPTQGRWISPDLAGMAAVDITNPQTLNRYLYALNNPLALIDPSGLDPDRDPDFQDVSPFPGICIEGPVCALGGGSTFNVNGIAVPSVVGQNFLLTGQGGSWVSFMGQYAAGLAAQASSVTVPLYGWIYATAGVSAPNGVYDPGAGAMTLLAYWGMTGSVSYNWPVAQFPTIGFPDANAAFNHSYPPKGDIITTREAPRATAVTAPPGGVGTCMGFELINNFIGSDDKTAVSFAVNIAPFIARKAAGSFLPGPGWLYTATAVIYDTAQIGKAYVSCNYNSVLGDAE